MSNSQISAHVAFDFLVENSLELQTALHSRRHLMHFTKLSKGSHWNHSAEIGRGRITNVGKGFRGGGILKSPTKMGQGWGNPFPRFDR